MWKDWHLNKLNLLLKNLALKVYTIIILLYQVNNFKAKRLYQQLQAIVLYVLGSSSRI